MLHDIRFSPNNLLFEQHHQLLYPFYFWTVTFALIAILFLTQQRFLPVLLESKVLYI